MTCTGRLPWSSLSSSCRRRTCTEISQIKCRFFCFCLISLSQTPHHGLGNILHPQWVLLSKKPFYVYFRILHAYTIIYLKYRVYCLLDRAIVLGHYQFYRAWEHPFIVPTIVIFSHFCGTFQLDSGESGLQALAKTIFTSGNFWILRG